MKKQIGLLKLILLLPVFFSNFNYKTHRYPEFKDVLTEINTTSDSVRIPRTKDGSYLQIYHCVKDWSRQLKLKTPDTGMKSFQLRIWIDIPGLSLRQRLFVLECNSTSDDFSAELIRFEESRANARDMFSNVINVKKEAKIPKSGWPTFTKKLFAGDFLLVFDENNGYKDQAYMDSDSYCFEIITTRNYWFSNFGALHEEGSNRKVVGVVKGVFVLIENEFDFDRL